MRNPFTLGPGVVLVENLTHAETVLESPFDYGGIISVILVIGYIAMECLRIPIDQTLQTAMMLVVSFYLGGNSATKAAAKARSTNGTAQNG